MQDRLSPAQQNPLATHGRTIHAGQTRKSALVTAMSAFTPIATKLRTSREVRFVPKPEIVTTFRGTGIGIVLVCQWSLENLVGP